MQLPVQRELIRREEAKQQAFLAANRAIAAERFRGQFGVHGEFDRSAMAASIKRHR
jgi:hypothetical protein